MKRFFFFLVLAAPFLMAPWACNQSFSVPPSAPAPPPATPTATITPGCQTSGLNIITGSGMLGGPIAIYLTPQPTPTPAWSLMGSLPPHSAGTVLIQTASDWSNYVATSYDPTGSFPIPFNPATQAMVVVAIQEGNYSCPDYYSISSVCNNGSQITVQVDDHQSCCGTVIVISGLLNATASQAVIINTFGLPVSINQTYYPYTGPMCM